MAPSIVAYNSFAQGGGQNDWALIEGMMPGVSFKADMDKYLQLMIYLTNICLQLKDPSCFCSAANHDALLDCMKHEWNIQNRPYRIYNIDHHHDAGYGDNLTAEVLDGQPLSCANWATKIQEQFPGYKRYTWINNFNSETGIPDDIMARLPNFSMCSDINLINFIQFDYVFLCSSPGWTPPNYIPLFEALRISLEKLINK